MENHEHINNIKNKGGTLWFLEHKKTHLWWHSTFEEKDDLPCRCGKCYPSGYPFKTFKDGWTNNPQEANAFITKKEAEKAIFSYYTDEPEENLIITEHEFVA